MNLPVIGVCPICNTGAVLVHDIDKPGDHVLASINGVDPEWCEIVLGDAEEQPDELGFFLGEMFVELSSVMR